MTFEERMKNGELYSELLEEMPQALTEELTRCKELLYDFNHTRPRELRRREELLRQVFAETGEHIYIEPPLYANWGCHTHVGENFYANFHLTLVDDVDIYIGDHVMLAPNVVIATGTHPVCPALREQAYQYNLPVHIGNAVWVGAGAIILPGVTIGDGSVIGAGSVVTRDIPAGVVAVGNPCRVLRPITEEDARFFRKDHAVTVP